MVLHHGHSKVVVMSRAGCIPYVLSIINGCSEGEAKVAFVNLEALVKIDSKQ